VLRMSKSEGTGGVIKNNPEEFIVKEITSTGIVLEPNTQYTAALLKMQEDTNSKFTVFVMQKKEWNTVQALATIARKLGRGVKSVSYAGTKDRNAVTVQLASIFGTTPEAVANVHVKDISINGAWQGKQVELGDNLGNSFEVTIKECQKPENIEKVLKELKGLMPNYFGEQRFGIRSNNASIGLHILRNELKDAAMTFLTDSENETNEQAVAARKRLAEEQDFAKALDYFPKYLKLERAMLRHLAHYSADYAGALRTLPRGIAIMFIHAVQSSIFNEELEERIRNNDFATEQYCTANSYGFPDLSSIASAGEFPIVELIGYNTDRLNEYQKEILERMQLKPQDFKIKSMPELSMKGTPRALLTSVKDIDYKIANDQITLKFSLPSGSYATVFLNEIMGKVGNK